VTQERWRGQDDLDAHLQTQHVAEAFAAAGEALATAPGIHPLVPVG
jgi:quinol monooxygenase YgiN